MADTNCTIMATRTTHTAEMTRIILSLTGSQNGSITPMPVK